MENKTNSNDLDAIIAAQRETENEVVISTNKASHHSEHHSRHHHHSSNGGHHSGKRRSRSRKSKNKKKVNKKLIWALIISLIVLLVLMVSIVEIKHFYNIKYDNDQNTSITSDVLTVEVINSDGVLVKDAVSKYLGTDLLNSYNSTVLISDFTSGSNRLDVQVPVALKLSTDENIAKSYKVELSDNDVFNNSSVYYFEADTDTLEFKHLYANYKYFYRVTAYTSKGIVTESGSFKTADTPRILSIDGISNVRDIGNWRTDSGKRIKQGLLIRGTEMDGAVESGYHLTNDGLSDMVNVFGIKTDMDLRAQTATSKDALGARVEHEYYDMVMYNAIFNENGKDKIRAVFADLANPDNYPIYLHCTYGCDRTGTVCYLLEALLGVSRGDCLKDYGLSNLEIANIQKVEEGLKEYEGSTLKEQTESYLLSCGVSEGQIESIRNIFLGD